VPVFSSPRRLRRRRPAGSVERLVRGVLSAYAVGLVGGLIASEYVGATFFAYLVPFVVGVACGGAATRAAGTDGRGSLGATVRSAAAGCAVLGVGLGFVLEGSLSPTAPRTEVLWTLPPRVRQGLSTEV
jgi:hypothetical protein